MATSDLLAELSKDSFRAAPDVEKKVVAVVLRQLDDQSGDVSTLAVKCLPPLVRGCGGPSVVDVVHGLVERLCAEEGKDARARRDAGVIGLKTVLAEIPAAHENAGVVVKTLVPKLVAALAASLHSGSAAKNTGAAGDVAGDCLDVLHAAAAGLGAYMTSSAADGVSPETARELEAALVKYLAESGRPGTRKKAATCLASLGATAGDGFLARCASAARREIAEAATRPAAERDALAAPYAHLLGAMAHAAGARFGAHAFESLPCVVSLLAASKEEGSESLRETCLRTLERFAEECPRATAAALPAVVAESLRLVSHDPVYGEETDADDVLDEDEHMDDGTHADDNDDDGSEPYGSEYDASEYSDDGDDDASWKIRRGAARVLRAVSAKAPFALEKGLASDDSETTNDDGDGFKGSGLFVALVRKLIARGSRERDESCRLDVFAALEAALRAASPERGASASLAAAAASVAPDVARSAARWCSDVMTAKDKARGVKPTFKTRTAAFGVLHELFSSVPGAFASDTPNGVETSGPATGTRDAFGVVTEACAEALESTGGAHIAGSAGAGSALDAGSAAGVSELRVAAARFAGTAARFFDTRLDASAKKKTEAARLCRTLAPPLAAATRDAYYKTAAEALVACEALVPAFAAALEASPDASVEDGAFLTRAATSLVAAAAEGVGAADRDAEVKAAATRCAGAACARLGVFLDLESVSTAVEGLVDRLSNEATRVGAAKALAAVFASPHANARAVAASAPRAAALLTPFLRQADRATRHASLEALGALVERRSDDSSPLSDALVADVVTNAAACVADAEPAAAATALFLASAALRRAETLPESARAARSAVLPAALALVKGASASALFGGSFRGPERRREGAGSGKGVGDTLRSLRDALRAFFAALGSPVASRVTKCGHAEVTALLFEETQTETAETALVDRASGSSFDAGAVAVAECAAAACASAGGNAVAECAASLTRELESEATQNATNATPRSGRSRLAMYCLGELARLPPSAGRASALGDARVAASFETLARDAFETRSEKKSGVESRAQTSTVKHGDESFVTPAAFALGGACAGLESRARFLPFVVAGVADAADARAEYAFLVATREAIFSASRDDLRVDDGSLAANSTVNSRSTDDSENRVAQTESSSFFTSSETSSLVEALLAAAERTKEEGARAVVAECLGRLAARETSLKNDDDDDERSEGLGLMARLRGDARDARLGPGRRSTAIAAAKHAVLHCYTPAARAALIHRALPGFVTFETVTDAATRVAATRCLSAAAHAEPAAVASSRATDWIGAVAPAIFAQTPVDKTLVRVVDLGPFKHTVDDGLETRKAAFECLATLLDAFRTSSAASKVCHDDVPTTTGDFLDGAPPGFANGVATAASLGAGDHYDVKIVAHALIGALVKSRLGLEAARGVLPETCAAFKATLTARLKSDAVKQETDRAADLARSCLRAVAALQAKLGSSGHEERDPAFAAFVAETVMTEKHAKAFEDARAAAAEEDGVAA